MRRRVFATTAVLALTAAMFSVAPSPATAGGRGAATYNGFRLDDGKGINVVRTEDGLVLDDETRPFPFLWAAVSSKGTVVKIDTETGAVLGEYRSAPDLMGKDPSRTTVDKHGNVWVANRAEGSFVPATAPIQDSGAMGSVVHIGLEENGQCVDRNGNGVIDTSTGLNDIRPWTNANSADRYGGVATASDECIIHYTRVNATGTRHVSVTETNDVWVSGTGDRNFDLLSGVTGEIIRREPHVNCGGYGGLIDAEGVIWSARPLLRWDTELPLVTGNYRCYGHDSYGLGIDSQGNVWNSALQGNQIRKIAPDGTILGTFGHGDYYAQGVVVDANDDVWVAHSVFRNSVGHIRNDGTFVGKVTVGSGPTGVAVDAAGKVWTTNHGSQTVSRIHPALANGVGAVDLTTTSLGGSLYNYSDMTGSVLIGAPTRGTWTLVHDSEELGYQWKTIAWGAEVPDGASLDVRVASSDDGKTFGLSTPAESGMPLTVDDGRYLRVTVTFEREASEGESPVLRSLTIGKYGSVLDTEPSVAFVDVDDGVVRTWFPEVRATLTDASSGLPIVGVPVEFSAVDSEGMTHDLCIATTDAEGVASCQGNVESPAVFGVEATFDGDDTHVGTTDDAPAVHVEAGLP